MQDTTINPLVEAVLTTHTEYLPLRTIVIAHYIIVVERNYILVVPEETLLKDIDKTLIEEHLIVPSKYISNRFQSLTGKVYTYLPENSTFKCTAGNADEIHVLLKQQDIFYTFSANAFRRFIIDNVLDSRYYSNVLDLPNIRFRTANSLGKKQPPYCVFNSAEDFVRLVEWNASENGMSHLLDEARLTIKAFIKSYIYVKNYEEDYGNQLKMLCRKIETLFSGITVPLAITNLEERKHFPRKLAESLVFSESYESIQRKLCNAFEKEEKELSKVILNLKLKNDFNPVEYGQDRSLLGCKFKKARIALRDLNKYKTPFEKAEQLKVVHKLLTRDIAEYWYRKGISPMPINADILMGSLVTALLKSKMEHPVISMLFLMHFLHVEYSLSETSLMIANYVAVVKRLSETAVDKDSGVIECEQEVNMKDVIVKDFFVNKKKEVLAKMEINICKPVVIAYTKRYDDYFGPEKMISDAETDEYYSNVHK